MSEGITRRALLRGAAAAAVAVTVGGSAAAERRGVTRATRPPRVVVVGAGLAGLTCAHRIHLRSGVAPLVFEARQHVGGRTWTLRAMPGGAIGEAGGQGIGTYETPIRALCAELGVGLFDTWATWPDGAIRYRFVGRNLHFADLRAARRTAAARAEDHFAELGWPVTAWRSTARARYWDAMSAFEWIARFVPGGADGAAGRFERTRFEDEYGGPAERASAVALIEDLGGDGPAGSDERWSVVGGNDLIARALARRLPAGSLRLGERLVALRLGPQGRPVCTFSAAAGEHEVTADRLVLALPFAVLAGVALDGAGLPDGTLRAIRELGMGQNTKLHLAFDSAPWQPAWSGETWSDGPLGTTWPTGLGGRASGALIVSLTGGSRGVDLPGVTVAHGPAPAAMVGRALEALAELLPGARAAARAGGHRLDGWPLDPLTGGSYAFYGTGGFNAIAGLEHRRIGRIHFSGEHTAPYPRRGTMNGAVVSGERAAREVLAAIDS